MAKKEIYLLKDGREVPGVTSVIGKNLGWSKNALMYWAWKQGKDGKNFRETSEEAAQAGTVAHYLIDSHIKGYSPEVDKKFPNISEETKQRAESGYLNFREWTKLVKFKSFLTEQVLISEQFLFGGRVDCIGFIGNKLSIIDWKCASGVYEDHIIQLAAYGQLWKETNKDKHLDGGFHILLFSKEGAAFSHHFWNTLKVPWQVFLHILEINNLAKETKKLT